MVGWRDGWRDGWLGVSVFQVRLRNATITVFIDHNARQKRCEQRLLYVLCVRRRVRARGGGGRGRARAAACKCATGVNQH